MQQLEQIKAQYEAERMTREAQIKKDLMDHEFQIQIRLAKLQADAMKSKEDSKEDRKDERTKIQATQQSELIEQRKSGKPPKNFETPKQQGFMPDIGAMGGGI
jgi:cell division septum initiation protein DivIVA